MINRFTVLLTSCLICSLVTSWAQQDTWTYLSPTWSPKLQVNQIETSGYPDVTIYASATYAGNPMDGLAKSDFRIREDDIDQPIISVSARREPISVCLLLDVSGSMKGSLPAAQEAAAAFVRSLAPNDRVSVMTFHKRIDTLYPLGNDFKEAERVIRQTQPLGDTALYDGILQAINSFENISGRRAVVVLSDGVDDNGYGSQLSQNDVDISIVKALASSIPIYTIGLGSNIDEGVLRAVSGSTGANYISSPTAAQLLSLYEELGKQLAGQYAIRYRSTSIADGSVRGIKLDYVIPSSKPFASPKAVVKEGNVIGYRAPELTRAQKSEIARLAGLAEYQRRYNLPQFKNIDIEPNAVWPKWLPKMQRVVAVNPAQSNFGNKVFEFTTTDSEITVIGALANEYRKLGWDIVTETSIANISTAKVKKGVQSVSIGAVRESGQTKVVAEYEGKKGPIYISANRKDQVVAAGGREVVVSGSYSKLRIVGHCKSLSITGEGNNLLVDTIGDVKISGSNNSLKTQVIGGVTFYGDKNSVAWEKSRNDANPKIKDLGSTNKIKQANW